MNRTSNFIEAATMSAKQESKGTNRTHWLDEKTETPLIDQYVQRLGTFLDAMADGRIDASELKSQEARVVALMKTIEPALGDELHEQLTHLLCELSAYNIMHTIHQFVEATPKTRFRG
jgi:alpha-D-ribose 1-methylphosphonate 5-triphosphate diphosphatase PhnM